jgi:hypothetical protein
MSEKRPIENETTQTRIAPTELSRKQVDSKTIQTRYKAGYGFASVTSRFSEYGQISDLIYQIAKKHSKPVA